jgi:hypothetical protein
MSRGNSHQEGSDGFLRVCFRFAGSISGDYRDLVVRKDNIRCFYGYLYREGTLALSCRGQHKKPTVKIRSV